MDLKTVKKAHFIGLGGVGMSAVALLLRDMDIAVTGSDEEVYDPIKSYLDKEGLVWATPYAAANLPTDADLIVIGKNAKLTPEHNPEVAAAFQSGKPIVSYPDILAEISKEKDTTVVAGSYGKSTSTALLAHCLAHAGLDPSYVIGAVPLTPARSARLGTSAHLILEGDEYPSSNTDPRSKFLHYAPKHLLLTPLAHDHFNIFKTPADYLKPFAELMALVQNGSAIVACTEGPLSQEFLTSIKRPLVTYGVREGDYTAADIVWGEQTRFTLVHKGAKVVDLTTSQLGEHNIQNIVGVAALILERNLMSPEQLRAAVREFKGITRRLDRKSDNTSIPIYEGFGSSYEKLRSAIAAMKLHFPDKQLVIVFEPHTFSWRNRDSLPWYDSVFEGATKVYVFEPPHDGKETQLSLGEIVERVKNAGIEVYGASEPEHVMASLQQTLGKGDALLLSTSGDLGGLIESIPQLAEQKFPA